MPKQNESLTASEWLCNWARDSEFFAWFKIILGCILLWAFLFGVTVDGKHYGFNGCSESRGVGFDWGK